MASISLIPALVEANPHRQTLIGKVRKLIGG